MKSIINSETGEVTYEEWTQEELDRAQSCDTPDQSQQVLELLGNLSPDQLQRVIMLGVTITEPGAVETLVNSVSEGDALTGIAVVAEAATVAVESIE